MSTSSASPGKRVHVLLGSQSANLENVLIDRDFTVAICPLEHEGTILTSDLEFPAPKEIVLSQASKAAQTIKTRVIDKSDPDLNRSFGRKDETRKLVVTTCHMVLSTKVGRAQGEADEVCVCSVKITKLYPL